MPDRKSRLRLLALALVAIGGGMFAVLGLWPSQDESAGPSTAATPVAATPAADPIETVTDPPRTALPKPDRPAASRRKVVSRPSSAPPSSALAALEAEDEPDAEGRDDEQEDDDGPVDRRAHPSGDSEQLVADIRDGMDMVRDDISDCIEDWAELEPGIDGTVMVRFSLDANGLQDAWIEQHDNVPAGPLTCFSAAVWEVDWADITEEPLEVSFPFEVTTDEEEER